MRRLLGSMFAITFAMGIANLVLPLHAEDLGASYTEIGLLGVTYVVFNVALSIPVGRTSDKYGRKTLLGLGMGGMPIIFFLFFMMDSVTGLLSVRLVQGIVEVPIWVLMQTSIADRASAGSEGRAMGKLGTSWSLGFASGPVIGGLLYGSIGAEKSFLVSLVIAVIAAANFVTISFPEPTAAFHRIDLRKLWKPCILGFIYTGAVGVVLTLFPPYARGLGIASAYVGGMITLFDLTRAVSLTPLGELVDRIGRRKMITGGLVGMFISLSVLGSITNSILLTLPIIGLAAAGGAIFPAVTSTVSSIGGKQSRGYAFGVYNTASMAGWGVLPGIGGRVADLVGASTPYLMTGAIVGILAPVMWFTLNENDKSSPSRQEKFS